MAQAHAVGRARGAQRELGDAEGLVGVVGVRAAQAQDRLDVEAAPVGQRPEQLGDLVAGVGIVAGRHGRVGREHRALAGMLDRLLECRARGVERGEGRVALVEVHDVGLDAQRAHDAREPPTPSSAYWLSRITGSPT